jgi:hypothetical protein
VNDPVYIYIYKNGCVCVCMSGHNSGTPAAISTKLGTHIATCMCKNLMYVLYIYIYIYLSPKHQFPKGIWMIHIVEEIKLLLLLGNGLKHIRGIPGDAEYKGVYCWVLH